MSTLSESSRTPARSLGTRLTLAVLVAVPSAVVVGLLVLAVEGSWSPLHDLDRNIADSLHTRALAHPLWVHSMMLVSDFGSPTVFRVLVGLLAVVLWLRHARRLALWAAATMAGGALIDVVLKTVINRTRPHFPNPVATAGGPSFPSGHAFTATLGAGVLVLFVLPLLPRSARIAVWIAGVAVPLLVGYSRLALGVHWASDVLGGWLLGVGLLAATTAAFEAWRRDQGLPPTHTVAEGVAPEETEAAAHAPSAERDPSAL